MNANQFLRELAYGYEQLSSVRLVPNYFSALLRVFSHIITDRPPPSAQAYAQLLKASIVALCDFAQACPPEVHDTQVSSLFRISRPDIIPLQTFEALAKPFKDKKADFQWLFNTYDDSPLEGSRWPRNDDPKSFDRWLKATEKLYDDAEPIQRQLSNSPFYRYRHYLQPDDVPFAIPHHSWFEGTWIVAPSGRGKTTLLKYLVSKVPEPDACIIFLDAKGELLQAFNQLAQWKDRYVYLQPSAEFPLAINPLEIGHSVEFLEYIFAALLESKMTPNQSTMFRMVLTLCKVIPNANLETFRLILSRGPKQFEEYVRKLKPRDQDFFDLEWKERIYAERRPEVLARLRTLMTHDALDAMLQAPHTKVDLGTLMDAGKIICINNNYEELGEQGCEFFGRLFIALVWAAARKRSQRTGHKRPVYFFIDEAHYVIARDPKISTILNQCRAQNISMFFAHQQVQQIKDEDVKAALNDCAVKFANSTGEAHELAPRLQTTPEFLKAQKRGHFALYVRDTTDTAVSVSITPVDLAAYPKLSRNEVQAILVECINRYCYQYSEQTYSSTEEAPPADDGTLNWKRTLSPKIALKGGYHNVPVTGNDGSPKTLKIIIKPNTQHGDKVRIKGYGALKRDRTRGDIIVEWIIPQRADHAEPKQEYRPFGISAPDREERW